MAATQAQPYLPQSLQAGHAAEVPGICLHPGLHTPLQYPFWDSCGGRLSSQEALGETRASLQHRCGWAARHLQSCQHSLCEIHTTPDCQSSCWLLKRWWVVMQPGGGRRHCAFRNAHCPGLQVHQTCAWLSVQLPLPKGSSRTNTGLCGSVHQAVHNTYAGCTLHHSAHTAHQYMLSEAQPTCANQECTLRWSAGTAERRLETPASCRAFSRSVNAFFLRGAALFSLSPLSSSAR